MKSGEYRRHIIILISATVLVYLNSFKCVFQLDDYNVIVYNSTVHSWSAWWADASHGGIRPLLKAAFTLNWTSGMGLFGFHLFNLCIHIANSILIYVLTCKLITVRRDIPDALKRHIPFITALLFALHPVQTEAVTYISGRSASLMSLFYMGSLLAYAYGRDACKSLLIYALSPVLFLFAVAVKEPALTLPAALLLWEATAGKSAFSLRQILRFQWLHWALLCSIALSIIIHPGYRRLILFSFNFRSIHDNLLSQIHGVVYLISRLVMVNRLNIDPGLPVITQWSYPLILQASFLGLVFFIGILCWKKYPWAFFGICWFFLHLLPANSFIPRIDIINERHFYLAGWGILLVFSTGIAMLLARTVEKPACLWASIIIISLISGIFTLSRNHVYRSEIALWEDTALKSPNKARIFNNLGYAYYLAGRFDDARNAYLMALQLEPDFVLARNNLSLIEH